MSEIKLTKLTLVLDNTIQLMDKYMEKMDQGFNIEGRDKNFFQHLKEEFIRIRESI